MAYGDYSSKIQNKFNQALLNNIQNNVLASQPSTSPPVSFGKYQTSSNNTSSQGIDPLQAFIKSLNHKLSQSASTTSTKNTAEDSDSSAPKDSDDPQAAAEKYKAQGAENGIEHQSSGNCFGCAAGNMVAAITGKKVDEDQVNNAINQGHGSVDSGGTMDDAAEVANEVAGKKVAETDTASSDQELKDKMKENKGKPIELTVKLSELTGESTIDKPTSKSKGKYGGPTYGDDDGGGSDDSGASGGGSGGDDHAVLAYQSKDGGFDVQDTGSGKWYHVQHLKDGGCSHDNQIVVASKAA